MSSLFIMPLPSGGDNQAGSSSAPTWLVSSQPLQLTPTRNDKDVSAQERKILRCAVSHEQDASPCFMSRFPQKVFVPNHTSIWGTRAATPPFSQDLVKNPLTREVSRHQEDRGERKQKCSSKELGHPQWFTTHVRSAIPNPIPSRFSVTGLIRWMSLVGGGTLFLNRHLPA